ncbi:hypothetical protein CUMW_139900 [Citrus unshiu]|nr:hypothetical protein CUMW_139900 [Citrus unshiu]
MSYLLSMSGFNFDNNKMMILCEKNVFDEFAEVIFELYDRATGANAGNADDDKDEVCEEDNVDVNVGSHLVNEPIMDDFIDDMSLTPQSHVVPQKVENALSSSTNSIETIIETVVAMVPKIDRLVNVLSTADKDVTNFQVKLYNEMTTIEGLTEDEMYDSTTMMTTKHDLLRVFFTMPNHHRKRYILQMLRHGI